MVHDKAGKGVFDEINAVFHVHTVHTVPTIIPQMPSGFLRMEYMQKYSTVSPFSVRFNPSILQAIKPRSHEKEEIEITMARGSLTFLFPVVSCRPHSYSRHFPHYLVV